jgi:hypothetical protein
MTIRPDDLDTFADTLDGFCCVCFGDLKYMGDLTGVSYFLCVDCGMEHSVAFGGER